MGQRSGRQSWATLRPSQWRFCWQFGSASLFRARRRSALAIGAVAAAVAVAFTAFSLTQALMGFWEKATLDSGLGEVSLLPRASEKYFDLAKIRAFLPLDLLAQESPDRASAPRLRFEAMLAASSGNRFVQVLGVDAEREAKVSPFTLGTGVHVRFPEAGTLAVGARLARSLALHEGDEVTIVASTAEGSTNAIDLRVGLIFHPASPERSGREVVMNISDGWRLVRHQGRISEMAFRFLTKVDSKVWAAEQAQNVSASELQIKHWSEIEPVVRDAQSVWRRVLFVLMSLVALITFLAVLNSMALIVHEQLRDLSIMAAVGGSGSVLSAIVATQCAIVGVIGSCLGAVLGICAIGWLGHFGVDFNSPVTMDSVRVFPRLEVYLLASVSVVATLLTTFSGVPLSARIAKLNPIPAMRGIA